MTEIASCPHCGHTRAPSITDSEEHYGEYWDGSDALCFAVVCDASRPGGLGGCGASSGFCETKEKAIESWNRRATPAPAQPEPSPGAEGDAASWCRPLPLKPGEEKVRYAYSRGPVKPNDGHAWEPLPYAPSSRAPAAAPKEMP